MRIGATSRREVIGFYDRFGARQDRQGWYEDPALERLVAAGRLAEARQVVEFGCGTGRLAARLLAGVLPPEAHVLALDASATMAALAAERLAPWSGRAAVRQTDGSMALPVADGGADRVLCTYVLDLLGEADARALLDEAARVLEREGLLCTAGLTPGPGLVSGAVTALWRGVHRVAWRLVGGCRPVRVAALLPPERWQVVHREVVVAWGIPSEVLVAERR